MTIERTKFIGLLASLLLAAGQSRGADFNERYAAWQGTRPAPAHRASAQAPVAPQPSAPVEMVPAAPGTSNQRVLSNVYSAPVHTPDYNRPWTTSNCASCSHNATFEPAADQLGTCDYLGGGNALSCGPGGCGGGACGPCSCAACACGPCGGAGGGHEWGDLCSNPMVWLKLDTLLWWRQGRDFPALVTSDPTTESSTTAGILPDAQILLSGRVGTNMTAGGRVDFGFYIDPRQCAGYGFRTFGIGRDSSEFRVKSQDEPVLAIPFFDFDAGANDALLVAYPGLRTGVVAVTGSQSVFGNDVYGRYLLCRDCNNRLDFITGWHYSRIADNLDVRSRSTVTEIGGTIPVGTRTTIVDQFDARNEFHGAILGLQWQRSCGVWTTQWLGRISIGNMHESMNITGSTQIAVPGQPVQNSTGGILTAASNIGRFSRDEFTAITELGFNLGYRFNCCTQLNIGYTFIYWNDILGSGTAIDPAIGDDNGTTRPQFTFRHSDFWVQGLNLGLTKEF